MEKSSAKIIKEVLQEYGAKPNKGLGQNFLIDNNILEKIITASDITNNDVVVEIGPGMGVLTQALAKKAKQVICIEKDPHMVAILKKTLIEFSNVTVIEEDVLEVTSLPVTNYKLVANIPYYITAPIIRKFLENPPDNNQPKLLVLMMQKEVAQRICTSPPDMNLLAVSVQYYATPKIVATVSKNSFWPSPKIDSAILKITPKEKRPEKNDTFFTVVKAGFSQPRKQLANNLSSELNKERPAIETWLEKNNISPKQRAETLTIADWQNLAESLYYGGI